MRACYYLLSCWLAAGISAASASAGTAGVFRSTSKESLGQCRLIGTIDGKVKTFWILVIVNAAVDKNGWPEVVYLHHKGNEWALSSQMDGKKVEIIGEYLKFKDHKRGEDMYLGEVVTIIKMHTVRSAEINGIWSDARGTRYFP